MNRPKSTTPRPIALAAIFTLPVLWGPTFAMVQWALRDFSPLAFVVLRFGIAGGSLLALSPAARRGLKVLVRPEGTEQRKYARDAMLLGAAIGGGYILQTIGLLTTTTSKSAFLTSTTVIWTPLLAFILGRERLSVQLILAIGLALAGIFLLTKPTGEGFVIGDLLTIGCAIAFAVYIAITDGAMLHALRFSASENEATMMIASTQIITSSLIFLIFLPILETPRVHFTSGSLAILAYTSLGATSLTAYLQTRFQHHVSPTAASLIYMLEPVVATLIAYVFLHEHLGAAELLGGGLIILGVIIAQVKTVRPSDTLIEQASEASAH